MRDANRLRRLVWIGPAPAGVASRPRARAAPDSDPRALGPERGSTQLAGLRRPYPSERGPVPKENAGRRAGRRHAPLQRVRAHKDWLRHSARRPPLCLREGIPQTSGAKTRREKEKACLKQTFFVIPGRECNERARNPVPGSHLDSGFAASRRPGMTRETRREKEEFVQMDHARRTSYPSLLWGGSLRASRAAGGVLHRRKPHPARDKSRSPPSPQGGG
jgi:hypothetical protein